MKRTLKTSIETLEGLELFGGSFDLEVEFSYGFTPEEAQTREYPGGGGELIFDGVEELRILAVEEGFEPLDAEQLRQIENQKSDPSACEMPELWAAANAAIRERLNMRAY